MANKSMGTLSAYLTANTTGFERGMKKALGTLKNFAVAAGAAFAVSKLKDFATESVSLYQEQMRNEKVLANAFRNSSSAVGLSLQDLKDYAEQIKRTTSYDDDAVMKLESELLSFGNIAGEQFKKAIMLSLDLSEQLGGDAAGNVKLLGKALSDPINGLTALRRAGVMLTDQQTDAIKRLAAAGKLEEAQNMLLAELQQKVGGAAIAAADPIKQLGNMFDDLKKSIGKAIVDTGILEWITTATQYISEHIGVWMGYFRDFFVVVKNIVYNIGVFFVNAWEVMKLAWGRAPEFWGAIWMDIKQTVDDAFEIIRTHFVEGFKMWGRILSSFGENWYDIFKDCVEVVWRSTKSIVAYFSEGIKQMGKMLASLGENFLDLLTGKKTLTEAIGNFADQYVDSLKQIGKKVSAEWSGFEFGAGTKKFASDVADAAKDYGNAVADASSKMASNFGKNTAKFVKDNANFVDYKSMLEGVGGGNKDNQDDLKKKVGSSAARTTAEKVASVKQNSYDNASTALKGSVEAYRMQINAGGQVKILQEQLTVQKQQLTALKAMSISDANKVQLEAVAL